jgi:hypothetical protein
MYTLPSAHRSSQTYIWTSPIAISVKRPRLARYSRSSAIAKCRAGLDSPPDGLRMHHAFRDLTSRQAGSICGLSARLLSLERSVALFERYGKRRSNFLLPPKAKDARSCDFR